VTSANFVLLTFRVNKVGILAGCCSWCHQLHNTYCTRIHQLTVCWLTTQTQLFFILVIRIHNNLLSTTVWLCYNNIYIYIKLQDILDQLVDNRQGHRTEDNSSLLQVSHKSVQTDALNHSQHTGTWYYIKIITNIRNRTVAVRCYIKLCRTEISCWDLMKYTKTVKLNCISKRHIKTLVLLGIQK